MKKHTAEGGPEVEGCRVGDCVEDVCVCVCDTEERAGQCLNVTTFLFAVNYYEDRAIGSVTRQSKHFLAHSEGDRKKRGFVFVCVDFFSSSFQK